MSYDCYRVLNRVCPSCGVTSVGERTMGYDNEAKLSSRYRKSPVSVTVSQTTSLEVVSC